MLIHNLHSQPKKRKGFGLFSNFPRLHQVNRVKYARKCRLYKIIVLKKLRVYVYKQSRVTLISCEQQPFTNTHFMICDLILFYFNVKSKVLAFARNFKMTRTYTTWISWCGFLFNRILYLAIPQWRQDVILQRNAVLQNFNLSKDIRVILRVSKCLKRKKSTTRVARNAGRRRRGPRQGSRIANRTG